MSPPPTGWPAHGGPLIDRWGPPRSEGEASAHRALPLDRDAELDAIAIADGSFSPLTGFLGATDLSGVLTGMRLASGVLWPLPVILQVEPSLAREVRAGQTWRLHHPERSKSLGTIAVEEVFEPDWEHLTTAVYGTSDPAHPGVARCLARGRACVAGPVTLSHRPEEELDARWFATPRQMRELISERGHRTITGFQTRNLGHRAHEWLQKFALLETEALLIHPLVGWKKPGDMLPETVLEGYELLRTLYFPSHRTLLAGLAIAMRYAGPREAVFHALIRKNFGCTHFVVGRDHAGVGDWYGTYAAHELLRSIPAIDLGIKPLLLRGPRYCRRCQEVATDATCPHDESEVISISGSQIRAMVSRGERPPPEIMRPEIADFLIARHREGRAFHASPPTEA